MTTTFTTTTICDQCNQEVKQNERMIITAVTERNPGGQSKTTSQEYHYAHAPAWALDELKR